MSGTRRTGPVRPDSAVLTHHTPKATLATGDRKAGPCPFCPFFIPASKYLLSNYRRLLLDQTLACGSAGHGSDVSDRSLAGPFRGEPDAYSRYTRDRIVLRCNSQWAPWNGSCLVLPRREQIFKSGPTMTRVLSEVPFQPRKCPLPSDSTMSRSDSAGDVTPASQPPRGLPAGKASWSVLVH